MVHRVAFVAPSIAGVQYCASCSPQPDATAETVGNRGRGWLTSAEAQGKWPRHCLHPVPQSNGCLRAEQPCGSGKVTGNRVSVMPPFVLG